MEGTMAPPALAVGFWTRFLAYIIDAIVLSIIGFALGFALAFTDLGFLAIQLVSMLVGWTYFVYFESSEMQATPGKMALGAKVSITQATGFRSGLPSCGMSLAS